MTKLRGPVRWAWIPLGACLGIVVTSGCHRPQPREAVRITNQWLGAATIAVAPAINLSGSTDFDPNRFADVMASELSYAEGVSVVPVSRVLAILATQGVDRVESPAHAWALAKSLNADAILVFAVTEYDPYDPPSIGITAQLYGRQPVSGSVTLDPVALSREPGLAGAKWARGQDRLLAQTQQVFDAAHQRVVDDLKEFAAYRSGDGSPYGWRRFVVSQKDYMSYCCHATVRALFNAHRATERVESAAGGGRR